jgi:hypothetical protein
MAPCPPSPPNGRTNGSTSGLRSAARSKGHGLKDGRLGWFGLLVIIVIAAVAIATVIQHRSGSLNEDESSGPEPRPGDLLRQFELSGDVIIFHPANVMQHGEEIGASCAGAGALADLVPGARVRISPEGAEPVVTELQRGVISGKGNCWMTFAAVVPEADSYLFEIGQREPVLRDEPRFFEGGGQGSNQDSWLSFRWDSDESPAVTPPG